MNVTIGIRNSPRELTLDTDLSPEDLAALVAGDAPLSVTDKKGRTVFVPKEALAYVEFGQESGRKVGFA